MSVSPEKIAETRRALSLTRRILACVARYIRAEDAHAKKSQRDPLSTSRDAADQAAMRLLDFDPRDFTSINTLLSDAVSAQLSGMTEETSSDPSMWATVVESEYDGELRWDCHTAGDMGDGDSLPTITLAADTFPAGTKLEIKEP